jgi:5-methylcytosine-specific restriction endonuclease McrA
VDAVLVVNADLSPLHRVDFRHAIRMLCRGVAEIHESEPDIRIGVWEMPTVVRLVRYVVTKWRYTQGPRWSRTGVLNRDNRQCAYCPAAGTTVDHVTPSSRGGKDTWTNTVAACGPCNQRKANKTPVEAGMQLRSEPYAPSWASLDHR